jgi:hypothetical protein
MLDALFLSITRQSQHATCKAHLQVAIVLLLLHLQPTLSTPHASPVRPSALHSIYDFLIIGGGLRPHSPLLL